MQPLSFNDLPKWSSWPARLLGLREWKAPVRDNTKVEQEYNCEKYAACLKHYETLPPEKRTPEAIRDFQYGGASAAPLVVSKGSELFLAEFREAAESYYRLLIDELRSEIEDADVVIELGCGYGINLWVLAQEFSRPTFLGGEYSSNAVELARRLYQDTPRIRVQEFDFYAPTYTQVSEAVAQGGKVVVFTSHAIEQLPSARHMVEVLAAIPRLSGVVHLEPLLELHGDTLLGLLRRAYADANDYNRDLYSSVRENPGIELLPVKHDVLGLNCFNPTSVVRWRRARNGE